MSVVVEVADDGDGDAVLVELVDDRGDGGCGFVVVDGDADQFRPGAGQGRDLLDGGGNVGGVGVGHRLHHDRCIAADAHTADRSRNGLSTLNLSHGKLYFTMRKDVELESERRQTTEDTEFH